MDKLSLTHIKDGHKVKHMFWFHIHINEEYTKHLPNGKEKDKKLAEPKEIYRRIINCITCYSKFSS